MQRTELEAGPNQTMVVYTSDDGDSEVDPVSMFGGIAADARAGAGEGWRIVSTSAFPTRHLDFIMGREGRGFETKLSVVVVYARP